jgi:tripartite ATP-independent transporter DctM subunit
MVLKKIEHSLDKVTTPGSVFLNSAGMGILVLMMLLTVVDVSLRFFLDLPIKGAFELTEFMMILIVFLATAYAAHMKRHIVVDAVLSQLPERVQMVIDTATCFLSLVICALIAWQSAMEAYKRLLTGQTSATLYIPIHPFIWVVALGCALLTLVVLKNLVVSLDRALACRWKVWAGLILGGIISVSFVTAPLWLEPLSIDLSSGEVGVISTVLLILLLASRMPIGFVLALLGFLGFAYLRGLSPGLRVLGIVPYSTVASVPMSIVPLFVLMGQFTFHSGISRDLYDTAHKWFGHLRGGLAMATTGACGAFAACTGASIAGAVIMGKVAWPEMKRHKYDPRLATGCIAAGGTIGTLIPPSIGFVMYGIMTEQSIGKLFIAGIVPGILEVIFYMATIHILCRLNPKMGPPGPKTIFSAKVQSLKGVWGMLILFFLVMGGIYLGVITPTEAGAIGAFGALIIALLRKKMDRRKFIDSLLETGQTTAMIFAIFVGAFIFGYLLTVTRLPMSLASLVTDLSVNRYVILGLIFVFYLILGCILDVAAMILITIPIVFPIVTNLGFDPIWFGVFMVRALVYHIQGCTPFSYS